MDRAAAGQRHRGRPQRIVGSGHEDLVAGIAQCLQAQGDELADAVAEEDLVGAEIVDPAGLVVLDDRAAAERIPRESEYPCVTGRCWTMSWTIASGASKPKGAGLPMLSLRIVCPAASMAWASSRTGPRMS